MRIFFDTEFTGMHQYTTLISIGLVTESGKSFYAELNDFDKHKLEPWIRDNVIPKLKLQDSVPGTVENIDGLTQCYGSVYEVMTALTTWLHKFEEIELWGDVIAYDVVLFNQLWHHALNVPKHIDYIVYDLATLLKVCGFDPDINREEFIDYTKGDIEKHNALWDAYAIKFCFEKVMRLNAGVE